MKAKAGLLARSHAEGLTLLQQNAVDLLAGGKNDAEAAAELGVHRVTVTRWRLYSLEFRAALAQQRAAVWGASADRLRAMIPKALDTLAEALEQGDDKTTIALAVLKLAGPLSVTPDEPTDPEEILRRDVEAERERARKSEGEVFDYQHDLPDFAKHAIQMRNRLAKLATECPEEQNGRP